MRNLHIDLETFCELDIKDSGVYKYAAHPSFRILLFAYAWGDGPVSVVDCHADEFPGESLLPDVWQALTDPEVIKLAHNANFEHVCLSTFYGLALDIRQWRCTMIKAAYLGLPLQLGVIAEVLGLDVKKDKRGKLLIAFFCKPCKPTKSNGGAMVNTPEDNPEKWEDFIEYNRKDVEVEQAIDRYTLKFPALPAIEWEYWFMDQRSNALGVMIDRPFVECAYNLNNRLVRECRESIARLTGVSNPNSVPQLKAWIKSITGEDVKSLGKEYLADAISDELLPSEVIRMLELRSEASKTSASKFGTMLNYAGIDDRIRGMIQFYGANRTGRYAGRGVQLQNLKRTPHGNLETAKEALMKGLAELLYDNVPDLISRLIRTALIAPPGKSFCVSDFSAIEARVLAWLAGEEWVLDVFRSHGKFYEATAANMFHVPIESVTKDSEHRAKGKVAALALGYQGASGALIQMGALREGLTEEELPAITSLWRAKNPNIVKFWRDIDAIVRYAIKNRGKYVLRKKYCTLIVSYERGCLFIQLPSGRLLAYYGAAIEGRDITFWGVDQVKKIWKKFKTYGGSLTENVTQAIARDLLTHVMYQLKTIEGIDILVSIHDEMVTEEEDSKAEQTLDTLNHYMAIGPEWSEGLPLKGAGYVSKYYRKD